MISKSDIQFPEIGGNARKVSALPCLLIRVASYPLIFLLVIGICTSPCFGQSNDKVPRVTVVNPVQKTLVYRLPAKPAEILAAQEAVLYARTSGYLDQISVDIGDQVEKGQIVATLDTPELADELNRAEARLLESTASLNAAKAQADGGNAHLVAARAAHRQAQAETLQEVGQQQKAEVALNAQKVQTVRIRKLHRQDAATDAQLEVAE